MPLPGITGTSMEDFPYLGHGIGLRPLHYAQVARGDAHIDWVEVISENFMVAGGNPKDVLHRVREHYPVAMHGVSLSLGSSDPLSWPYLDDLAALAAEVEPAWISDHVCWSSFGGHTGHDLWPLPFTEEALDHVARRIEIVQERLGRRILIENVSSYLEYEHSTIPEWAFLAELSNRSDCGLLLDVNNVFVNANNQGFDAHAFIARMPVNRVKQIHLAGHRDEGTHLLDTHDHAVCDEVWHLYRAVVARFGRVSTLIERDDDIPPLGDVVAESHHAAALEAEVLSAGSPPKVAPGG